MITKEMLNETCDFEVTGDGFSVSEKAFGKVVFNRPIWKCQGVKLSDLVIHGAFGGNSLRVAFVNTIVRKLKDHDTVESLSESVETEGISVAKLLKGEVDLKTRIAMMDKKQRDELRAAFAEMD